MKRLVILLIAHLSVFAAVIPEARNKLSAGDLTSAEAIVDEYYRASGANSEYAAAVSWLARGAFMLNNTEAASRYLNETKHLITDLLKTSSVEKDSFLTTAVGASIEVEARMLAAHGQRDKAVAMLESEFVRWKTWPLQARIQKNINLLTLVGKSAPELDAKDAGKPILLFLWAHWCGDCKAYASEMTRVRQKYESKGLLIKAPTRRYGTGRSEDERLTPEQEDRLIDDVWNESYAGLRGISHPVNEGLMLRYGVSSTPTMVLIDRKGIVQMYRPFRLSDAELSRQIDRILQD